MSSGSSRKVCASHILVKDEKTCLEIKAKILAKGTRTMQEIEFIEQAKKSTCPSGKEGGSLGEFGPG